MAIGTTRAALLLLAALLTAAELLMACPPTPPCEGHDDCTEPCSRCVNGVCRPDPDCERADAGPDLDAAAEDRAIASDSGSDAHVPDAQVAPDQRAPDTAQPDVPGDGGVLDAGVEDSWLPDLIQHDVVLPDTFGEDRSPPGTTAMRISLDGEVQLEQVGLYDSAINQSLYDGTSAKIYYGSGQAYAGLVELHTLPGTPPASFSCSANPYAYATFSWPYAWPNVVFNSFAMCPAVIPYGRVDDFWGEIRVARLTPDIELEGEAHVVATAGSDGGGLLQIDYWFHVCASGVGVTFAECP